MCLKAITIEPALLITFVAAVLSQIGNINLTLQKLCYKNGTGPVYGILCPEEISVQKEAAVVTSFDSFMETSLKLLPIIISSTWTGSRKRFMLYPMFGSIVNDVLCIVYMYFWNSSVWLMATTNSIIRGFSGNVVLLNIGFTLYASDHTSDKSRTFRIGVFQGIFNLSTPIGSILSGYLTVNYGLYCIFLITITANILAVLLILTMMRDAPQPGESKRTIKTFTVPKIGESQLSLTETYDSGLKDKKELNGTITDHGSEPIAENKAKSKKTELNPFVICVDNFRTLFKHRPNHGREICLLMTLCISSSIITYFGEFNTLYMYVRRVFGWTEEDFGQYAAFKSMGSITGLLMSVGLLSRVLKIEDSIIGILGSISLMCSSGAYMFAKTAFAMYIVPLIDIFHGGSLAVSAAILTKAVSPSELGSIISAQSVVTNAVPIISAPLYSLLYRQTVDFWPAAFFIVSIVLTVIVLVSFVRVYYLQKKIQSMEKVKVTENGEV